MFWALHCLTGLRSELTQHLNTYILSLAFRFLPHATATTEVQHAFRHKNFLFQPLPLPLKNDFPLQEQHSHAVFTLKKEVSFLSDLSAALQRELDESQACPFSNPHPTRSRAAAASSLQSRLLSLGNLPHSRPGSTLPCCARATWSSAAPPQPPTPNCTRAAPTHWIQSGRGSPAPQLAARRRWQSRRGCGRRRRSGWPPPQMASPPSAPRCSNGWLPAERDGRRRLELMVGCAKGVWRVAEGGESIVRRRGAVRDHAYFERKRMIFSSHRTTES